MSYNAKNYMEQGGEKWVIGGTLEILPGATVIGLPTEELLFTNKTTIKDVETNINTPKIKNQPYSKATDVNGIVADFNALIKKLIDANLMES